MPPEPNLERLSLISGVALEILKAAQVNKERGVIPQEGVPRIETFEEALAAVSSGLLGTYLLIRLIELWDGGQSVPFGA